MSEPETPLLIVASQPVVGVEPGHVAEARRALLAQGRDLGDAAIVRLLWVARALPVALDVLADARSDTPIDAPLLGSAVMELGEPPAERSPLVAVGHRERSSVVVDLFERRALMTDADVPAFCTIRFPIAPTDDAAVAVHRFTLGPS